MALISGFLRQKCLWTPRLEVSQADAFGNAEGTPVTVKCRWEYKSGWLRGAMGMRSASSQTSYKHKVFVDSAVMEGDKLAYGSVNGVVVAVETIVGIDGREEGRICYV